MKYILKDTEKGQTFLLGIQTQFNNIINQISDSAWYGGSAGALSGTMFGLFAITLPGILVVQISLFKAILVGLIVALILSIAGFAFGSLINWYINFLKLPQSTSKKHSRVV